MKIIKVKVLEKEVKDIYQYSLTNDYGVQVKILTLGGIITDIIVPDKYGTMENVVVKWDDLSEYLDDNSFTGAIVGRTAGRIADAWAKIDEKIIKFNLKNGNNQIHGGLEGFNKKIWTDSTEEIKDRVSLILEGFSKDGEENYPGNLNCIVKYSLTNENQLIIEYSGLSDKDTLLNMTNHSYFNLSGNLKRNILDEKLTIKAEEVGVLRSDKALSGEIYTVAETPFDFRYGKNIGKDINADNNQLHIVKGYDHPWILKKNEKEFNIKLEDEISGRVLEVITDAKAVVVYTTNYPDGEKLTNKRNLLKNDAICFETQSLSIGENSTFVEDSILKKDQFYKKKTIFKFYTK